MGELQLPHSTSRVLFQANFGYSPQRRNGPVYLDDILFETCKQGSYCYKSKRTAKIEMKLCVHSIRERSMLEELKFSVHDLKVMVQTLIGLKLGCV